MKSIIIVILISLFAICNIVADPVSKDEAQEVAVSWYKHIASSSIKECIVTNVHVTVSEDIIVFRVFSFKSGGFVIVAADDASIPILGYSIENLFPEDVTCPAVEEWLDNYSLQIIQIVKEGVSNQNTKAIWDAIKNGNVPKPSKDVDPLLTTSWGQGCYYNELCPADVSGPCGHAVTGCAATAMAQIMKYHDFPPQGVGSHSYPHPVYGVQSVDFGNTTYDWALMPDNVIESNIPVATIMYHAGVAVDMNYGASESGTYNELVPNALIEYFNYSPELQLHYQSEYTSPDEWKALLRADLDQHQPIYYSGFENDGGHAFVCDGYSLNDEKFHFNWGWNGSYDGWFAIGALAPGGLSLDQYNTVILGIKPYNPNLIVRISNPVSNILVNTENSVSIEAVTEFGNPEQMRITIDGETVSTGNTNTLIYSWNPTIEDCGSHEVKAWAIGGNDSVSYQINLNVSTSWVEQSSGFQTPLQMVSYISAVDENVAWAIPRDGINEWGTPIQEFTRTTDGGNSWSTGIIPDCEGLWGITVYAISDTKAYIPMFRMSGTKPKGIYVTNDGGFTWNRQETASFNSPYSFPVCIHFFNENDGFCWGDPILQEGSWEFEIYTTTDAGVNWVAVPASNKPAPLPQEETGPMYSSINDTIWFGTSKGRIFKSVDKGYNWTVAEVPGMDAHWICPVFRNESHGLVHNFVMQGELMVNGPGAIYETFDGGETWDPVNPEGTMYWTDLAYVPGTDNTWVSTGGHVAFECGASYSIDGGHTWITFPGTDGTSFRHMDWVNENCGWAGSSNMSATEGGVIKYVGDFLTSSATNNSFSNIKTLSVFPNPFKSLTTIEFSIPETDLVTILAYDISGKLYEKIVSGKFTKGKNKIEWNAQGLPAGIYFLRLETNNIVETKKLLLIK